MPRACSDPPLRLASTKQIDPYIQGQLDTLCGLYAAVNGLRLVAIERKTRLNAAQCQTLFRHGASFLQDQGKLSAGVRYGLRAPMWVKLMVELASKATRLLRVPIIAQRPLAAINDVTLDLVLLVIRDAIRSRQAALVLLKGEYEHYTVVSGVTATLLNLFDSCDYRFISIDSCSLAGQGPDRRHRLHAASLTVLG